MASGHRSSILKLRASSAGATLGSVSAHETLWRLPVRTESRRECLSSQWSAPPLLAAALGLQ